MSKKGIRILASIAVLLFAYVFAQISNSQENENVPVPIVSPSPEALSAVTSVDTSGEVGYKVTEVIDGDTIQIEGGYKIRYIGIDAPETVDPKRSLGCYGRQASDKNKELVLGKNVILEKDVSETDKFGRLLRYVYVTNVNNVAGPEASSGSIFVNDYLVRSGYAKVATYPPDVRYQEKFLESERYARQNNLGLWNACQN